MNAYDIMQPNVITSHEAATLREVAAHMVVGRISGFPIVDETRAVVGILTEIDVIKAISRGMDLDNTCVADVMTRNIIWVDAEAPLDHIMGVLEDERIIRVPVISADELVGIVSRGDVLKALLGKSERRAA